MNGTTSWACFLSLMIGAAIATPTAPLWAVFVLGASWLAIAVSASILTEPARPKDSAE